MKILRVRFEEGFIVVETDEECTISLPLSYFPRLNEATPEERENYRIFGDGQYVNFPDLDEDLYLPALLTGKRSRESEKSLNKWREWREKRKRSRS
ncbi:DUF2442 domain-containing protein [Anaerolinea sp.]|uniref:DUF2442 domain-containing protein n=1 Tax=Anaerolinea sp. TaxID=1872519 RepID=UPI002ACE22BC|nr:DUF2442 domain-containing protein [Anaerolinea sp.]